MPQRKLLLTFGCSWTLGVGLNYEPGMGRAKFIRDAWDQKFTERYSFRRLLCDRHGMDHVNFSRGGSSNQEQFKFAEDFFCCETIKKIRDLYDEIFVLWGITSILRNYLWFCEKNMMASFSYADQSMISKILHTNHFDHNTEVNLLSHKINFWNLIFDNFHIRNLWFDTFNHHHYHDCIPPEACQEYQLCAGPDWPAWQQFATGDFTEIDTQIRDEVLDIQRWRFAQYFGWCGTKRLLYEHTQPRDLLSQLALSEGMVDLDTKYHESAWKSNSKRIDYLVDKNILNPYSFHPTQLGHQKIADMFDSFFVKKY